MTDEQNNGEITKAIETIKCPYCGHEMKVDMPEPHQYEAYQIERFCSSCDMKVSIPILPKFNAKPTE